MSKEKILSSAKKTTSAPVIKPAAAPIVPKVDESLKYKEAIKSIVDAHGKLAGNTQDRNLRISLNQAIEAAGKII
tara:strand:- start:442 stop:666 length:225 start_codon:yes stop_codon:yes gene_type:complete